MLTLFGLGPTSMQVPMLDDLLGKLSWNVSSITNMKCMPAALLGRSAAYKDRNKAVIIKFRELTTPSAISFVAECTLALWLNGCSG